MDLLAADLAQACSPASRTKLLKSGAAASRNAGRLRVLLASAHQLKHVFLVAANALGP